ncbi:unnamed protein product [Darwinula stevensoni]|uniref:Transmembrane protein 65 n=1 Tax=Darwinula stevensoni TaxID=69355 RepID=A0A7R9A3S7_9CRUS|nr:unnamed protein product [Darwinula stevensoni]CAG0881938.1 unnamed protein product [Darwinula stevensoni]
MQGKLGRQQLRSSFGRPTKVPDLGPEEDPTGQFCEVPSNWLQKKLTEKVPKPTASQLWDVTIYNALPFIGFGFLDNTIMIVALPNLLFERSLIKLPSPLQCGLLHLKMVVENSFLEVVLYPVKGEPVAQIKVQAVWASGEHHNVTLGLEILHSSRRVGLHVVQLCKQCNKCWLQADQDWLQVIKRNVADKKPFLPSLRTSVFLLTPLPQRSLLTPSAFWTLFITQGDYIDLTIGTVLGISTLAAAALGNTVSDIAGIGSAFYVESFSSKIGVKPPDLTLVQLEMPSSRWSANAGRAVGVTIGCLLGMFPLLFLPAKDRNEAKEERT